jgi:NADH dehydrogenase
VGRHLVRAALDRGLAVRVVSRRAGTALGPAAPGVETAAADVADRASLARAFAGASAVVHLVGIIQERGRNTFEAVHARGTENVVSAARAAGVRRLVHMSALGTRPGAATPYHRTKWAGEEAVRGSGLDWTIHRPSVVYGPGDGFVSRLLAILRWSPVAPVPGDGRSLLQPVWIGDVAACFLGSLERPVSRGRTYELGGPRPWTLDALMGELMRASGRRRLRVHVPLPLVRAGAAVMERLLPNPPVTRDQLAMLAEPNVCDTTAMRADFDVEMVDLPEGLRRMIGGGR